MSYGGLMGWLSLSCACSATRLRLLCTRLGPGGIPQAQSPRIPSQPAHPPEPRASAANTKTRKRTSRLAPPPIRPLAHSPAGSARVVTDWGKRQGLGTAVPN